MCGLSPLHSRSVRDLFLLVLCIPAALPFPPPSTPTSASTVCCLPHCNCVYIHFRYPSLSRCHPYLRLGRIQSLPIPILFPFHSIPFHLGSRTRPRAAPYRVLIPAQPLSNRPSHRTRHPAIQPHPAAIKRRSPASSKHNFVPATCVTEHPTVPPQLVLRVAPPPPPVVDFGC